MTMTTTRFGGNGSGLPEHAAGRNTLFRAALAALTLPGARLMPPSGKAWTAALLGLTPARLDPDSDLLALCREWQASAERCDRASAALDAAYERLIDPPPPAVLFWHPRDPWAFSVVASKHNDGRRWYGFPDAIDSLRSHRLVDFAGSPLVRDRARRDEIVEAYDRWRAEIARAWAACGLDVAEAESDAADDENRDLRRRIMVADADTLAGVLAKARVAGWCWRGSAEMREQTADNVRRGSRSSEDIAFSLAADLVAMIERDATRNDPAGTAHSTVGFGRIA